MRKLSPKLNELFLVVYVFKINCKPILYIFFLELARFIGIKKFLEIYSYRSGDSMLESCHMILHKFRYHKNGLLNKEMVLKVSVFVVYIAPAVQ